MKEELVILGAGESGIGAAILAQKKGYRVFVSDAGKIKPQHEKTLLDLQIEYEAGHHSEARVLAAGLVVKSPGIPDQAPLIKKLRDKQVPVISEIELAGRYTTAKTICITGSNGKTTTTKLLYHTLKNAGLKVGIAGNVGDSFARQVAQNDFDIYVLELSSFQLDGMVDFRADIAILLNITPDHLDRYEGKMQNYINSKFRILQNQTPNDYFIFCKDDEIIQSELNKRKINAVQIPFGWNGNLSTGAGIQGNKLIIHLHQKHFSMSMHELALQGKHNTYNSMAAGIAGMLLEIRNEQLRDSLSSFKGVEHRLEFFLKVHGIDFVNDSKATNVNSTWYALETIHKPIVWIAGGVDKGNDYSMLQALVKNKVKAIVCLGKDNYKLHEAFGDTVKNMVDVSSMEEAVKTAYYLARNNDVVLLSPACASFDLFDNYEDRGTQFKQHVKQL